VWLFAIVKGGWVGETEREVGCGVGDNDVRVDGVPIKDAYTSIDSQGLIDRRVGVVQEVPRSCRSKSKSEYVSEEVESTAFVDSDL
jgi:hypothetical protein